MIRPLLLRSVLLLAVGAASGASEAGGSEAANGGQSLQALQSRCYSTSAGPKSGVALGSALMLGMGGAASPDTAAKAFRVACDAKLQGGCARLGDLAVRGKGTARDSARGLT